MVHLSDFEGVLDHQRLCCTEHSALVMTVGLHDRGQCALLKFVRNEHVVDHDYEWDVVLPLREGVSLFLLQLFKIFPELLKQRDFHAASERALYFFVVVLVPVLVARFRVVQLLEDVLERVVGFGEV